MSVKVFKFGGASVRNAEQIKNVGQILSRFKNEKLIVVISAMGKITNALEKVIDSYIQGKDRTKELVEAIKHDHYKEIQSLFEDPTPVMSEINDLFVEIDWIIEEPFSDTYDYIYDQIVSIGELASSKIVAAYLETLGIESYWLDIRDILITDDTYREAKVDWVSTSQKCGEVLPPLLDNNRMVITQGFIGSTNENNTTTLGREGSDYSAGIISFCIDADSMHIWKDVPGILTADPAQFDNVSHIGRLSYKEAVEMTYYGAKVIHPKTIKPLQNKSIPLYVRPFRNPESSGTIITEDTGTSYPPVIVIEPNQCLLHISTTDFSFVAEHHLSTLFELLAKFRLKVNMMRNTAISFTISITYDEEKIHHFVNALENDFKVLMDRHLELITIRHYTNDILNAMSEGKVVLLEERLKDTVRIVIRDLPMMVRKT